MKTLHTRCAGVDVHKTEVVVCLRLVTDGKVEREVRRFPTTTHGLLELAEWLESARCTHVAMEATGVYWPFRDTVERLKEVPGLGSTRP